MEIDRREILRYLGYRGYQGREVSEPVDRLIGESVAELEKAAVFRHVSRVFPLRLLPGEVIDFTCFQTKSRNLSRNLRDCSQVILFAATLGAGVDVLLERYGRLQVSKAVTIQAAATALLEAYCDEVNGRMKQEYEGRGLYLRPRFSPGYGDFPLECQRELTAVLETAKRVGITLTDSLLMAPSKSVTAVMGVSEKPYRCEVRGCEVCSKADCIYRRSERE